MKHDSHEPQPSAPTPRPCSTPHSAPVAWLRQGEGSDAAVEPPEAIAPAETPAPPRPTRHDGWTGERIATFLEVLADTGIVAEGYRAAGMSKTSAYSLRTRDPLFDAAWRAAQAKSRPVVADGLLERSITGTVEHYYRDGVLVGERRHYESWLGLAVLKRLDRQAEEDRADANLADRMAGDWQGTLDALRSGGTAAVPQLFAPEVDQVDSPPPPGTDDPSDNVWRNDDGVWMTIFPPPPGFDGHENRPWDGFNYYERACTPEEAELIEAAQAAAEAEELAEFTACAQAERDAWFDRLRIGPNASGHAERDSTSLNATEKDE